MKKGLKIVYDATKEVSNASVKDLTSEQVVVAVIQTVYDLLGDSNDLETIHTLVKQFNDFIKAYLGTK